MEESILGGIQTNYAGIDHYRQYSHLTLMDEEGQVFWSGQVPNLRAEIEKFLEGIQEIEAIIEKGARIAR